MQLESNLERGVLIGMSYSQGRNLKTFADDYAKKLKAITKEDVINIAKKYYGVNYLAFYSKMGFPKKEKIEKPGFKPLSQKQVAESEYAQKFAKIYAPNLDIKYFDFNKDIETAELIGGNKLYCTKNKKNDLFSMKIKYGIGTNADPKIKFAAEIINYSGTANLNLESFKNEFDKIGCNYSVTADQSYVIIELDGPDKQIPQAIKLLQDLCTNPKPEATKLNIIIDGVKAERKMERSEPDNIASALIEYAKYKEKSEYLNRLSMNEIKTLNVDTLAKLFKSTLNYQAEIHYVGTIPAEKLSEIMKDNMVLSKNPIKSNAPVDRKLNNYTENTIYFVNKKNALQSKNYVFLNSNTYSKEMDPMINAFNLYFSGDFSGLVLQEIREFRSLAYGAGASFRIPQQAGNECYLTGFVGTQSDKTVEAIQVFYELLGSMPEKPERIETIKSYLQQSLLTERPDFRDLSEVIVAWKNRGYTSDPAIAKHAAFNKLTFEEIVAFYKTNIKSKPLVFTIVGDEKRITNKDNLQQFGKIIKIKEANLFKD